ncbi:hypothetical protein BTN49_3325 [Candidatus Enterovibrio escicola]|uniref:Uncharacterized protein n=1 Tax=Candidatus Enterovibrio escicola TaxID=1927127 RepID=A0A2A5SZ46_9GAMM|nr:hypothetical protein BTN49_3325 [Candidatus Enterovibrio escacola]
MERLTKNKVEMMEFYDFPPNTGYIFERQTPLNQCVQL